MRFGKTNLIWLSAILPILSFSSAEAAPSPNDFECFADKPENEICLVIPPESPAAIPTASQLPTKAQAVPLMVSSREVSGSAATQPYFLGDASSSKYTPSYQQEAMSASYRSLEDLRWIETFLKTGPSALSDDIRVQPASRRISTRP